MKALKTLGLVAIMGLLASCGHMRGCKSACSGQCSTKKESSCGGQCPMAKESDKTAPADAPKAP